MLSLRIKSREREIRRGGESQPLLSRANRGRRLKKYNERQNCEDEEEY